MKMARATQPDLQQAMGLIAALDQFADGYLYSGSDDGDAEPPRFDAQNRDHLAGFYQTIMRIYRTRPSGLSRVVYGMEVLLDPANEIVDQNDTALALHPSITTAQALATSAKQVDADLQKWAMEVSQPLGAVCALTLAGGAAQTPKRRFEAVLFDAKYNGQSIGDWEIKVRQCFTPEGMELHGLDTPDQVFFYEQDYYPLSNFSAFNIVWEGHTFPTSEHVYQYEKFCGAGNVESLDIMLRIMNAPSAHEAFKIAEANRQYQQPDWDSKKVEVMREILRTKVMQHEYVERKLLATGNRELIENSWRDPVWGWGQNFDGQNLLGRCWMDVRRELRAIQ